MANQENKLDQFFREKLEQHEEKPSQLVWERLDQELGRKKSGYIPLFRLVASLILLLGIGYVLWQYNVPDQFTEEQRAEKEDTMIESMEAEINETLALEQEEITPLTSDEKAQVASKEAAGVSQSLEKTEPKKNNESQKESENAPLLAGNMLEVNPERFNEVLIELPEIPITELKIDQMTAMAEETNNEVEEEISYRVIIKSSGIKNEEKKPNIIEGLENNVNKIGTFLNKVEQGFADLQDAKNNLFASNSQTREESR
ncbi:hypothetical protein [Cecembia sp.]|uniref:hypothetical protein n=1 Tax=Cecembia sp. TaxID=1898110 RepID=UPI0025BA1EB1|nr:hypothetical protein [Cecembia sp.]